MPSADPSAAAAAFAVEYPLSGIINASAVMAEAPSFVNIRVLRADHLSTSTPQTTLRWGRKWDGSGECCTDRCGGPLWSKMAPALGSFSAVCFLAGRDLYKALDEKVPIGLVESAWGVRLPSSSIHCAGCAEASALVV